MTVRAEELWEGRDTHVILGGATDVAAFALDALPAVGLHCCHHHWGELQARRMPCGGREVKQELEMGGSEVTWTMTSENLWGPGCWLGQPSPVEVPERPQSEQDTSSSGCPVFLLIFESPRQKSQ